MKKIDSLDISDVEFCIFFEGMFTMCNKHGSYHQRKDVKINSFFLMSIQSKEEAPEYSNAIELKS